MNSNFTARGKTGEIWLYDPIGDSSWGDAVSAKSFQKELTAMGRVDTINLHINSPGGSVFDGVTIYNQLKQHPARVVVDIDGLAASIASVIAMAGDTRRMAKNASMMIHNPEGVAVGDENEMDRVKALLRGVKTSIVDTYSDRTGADRVKVSDWMDAETWFFADAAYQNGFVDEITGATKVTAFFDINRFGNVPASLRQQMQASAPTPAMDIRRQRIDGMNTKVAALLCA